MGEIKKGILGGFSGTVGTVVGANWRGKDIMRARPKSTNRPPTERQLEQRMIFKTAIKFLTPLRGIQSRYFGQSAGVRSRNNLSAAHTLRAAVSMENGIPEIIFPKVVITKGDLLGFDQLTVAAEADGVLKFQWADNSSQPTGAADDVFCSVVYCPELEQFHLSDGPALRPDAEQEVLLPNAFTGKKVQVYAYLRNAQETRACNSIYLGEVQTV